MAISGVSSYSSSVFQTPGVRPAESNTRVQPVPPADQQAQQATATQQDNQQTNTNPTDNERQEALSSGRTRGSFVNITA
ncbi:hypothetical protein [Niveispirillum sp.]|uniref:hypothetical protein n=1 Tax=Niveispirillum sp. TaxID=1917217 RepID=UPI001B4DBCF6|nr:hypothetical protein [Niveispirillum sp.]MBP7340278.1 hypothetical protein [Niveispirillum sp.]